MLLLDLDNDGRISLKEFLDFVSGDLFNYEPENTEQQKRLFRLFDMQNTGFVSEKDLKKSLEAFGEKATDDEIKDAIKLADKNGDGKVNYEGTIYFYLNHMLELCLQLISIIFSFFFYLRIYKSFEIAID